MNANVYFKATKDNIIIMLDEKADFFSLKNDLRQKVVSAKGFFGDATTNLIFRGRSLSKEEENELLDIISIGSNLKIASAAVEKTKTPKNPLSVVVAPEFGKLQWDNNNSIFHRGSIRSGKSISHKGSIVIIGDVNPGGEIIAHGNIIVLGSLKGLAFAGADGCESAFVAALNLVPGQLRIANIITSVAEEVNKNGKKRSVPSIAYLQDSTIFIEPLV